MKGIFHMVPAFILYGFRPVEGVFIDRLPDPMHVTYIYVIFIRVKYNPWIYLVFIWSQNIFSNQFDGRQKGNRSWFSIYVSVFLILALFSLISDSAISFSSCSSGFSCTSGCLAVSVLLLSSVRDDSLAVASRPFSLIDLLISHQLPHLHAKLNDILNCDWNYWDEIVRNSVIFLHILA